VRSGHGGAEAGAKLVEAEGGLWGLSVSMGFACVEDVVAEELKQVAVDGVEPASRRQRPGRRSASFSR